MRSSFFSRSVDLLALGLQRIARGLALGGDLLQALLGILALAAQQLDTSPASFSTSVSRATSSICRLLATRLASS